MLTHKEKFLMRFWIDRFEGRFFLLKLKIGFTNRESENQIFINNFPYVSLRNKNPNLQ
jgi:hypothetical protein